MKGKIFSKKPCSLSLPCERSVSKSSILTEGLSCLKYHFLRKLCENRQSLSRCATAPFTQGSLSFTVGLLLELNKEVKEKHAAAVYAREPIVLEYGCYKGLTYARQLGKTQAFYIFKTRKNKLYLSTGTANFLYEILMPRPQTQNLFAF